MRPVLLLSAALAGCATVPPSQDTIAPMTIGAFGVELGRTGPAALQMRSAEPAPYTPSDRAQTGAMPTMLTLSNAFPHRGQLTREEALRAVDQVSKVAAIAIACGVAPPKGALAANLEVIDRMKPQVDTATYLAILDQALPSYHAVNPLVYNASTRSCIEAPGLWGMLNGWLGRPTEAGGGHKMPMPASEE